MPALMVSCVAGGTVLGRLGEGGRRTFHGERGHEADGHYFWAGILGHAGSGDLGWVEVRGVIFL